MPRKDEPPKCLCSLIIELPRNLLYLLASPRRRGRGERHRRFNGFARVCTGIGAAASPRNIVHPLCFDHQRFGHSRFGHHGHPRRPAASWRSQVPGRRADGGRRRTVGRASPLPQCAQATSLRQPTLLTFVRRHFCVDATFVSLSSPARLLLFGRLRLELASGDVELLPQTISDGSRIDKGPFKWLRGVLAPDGHVYCIPACANIQTHFPHMSHPILPISQNSILFLRRVLTMSCAFRPTAPRRRWVVRHVSHTSLTQVSHTPHTSLSHASHTNLTHLLCSHVTTRFFFKTNKQLVRHTHVL